MTGLGVASRLVSLVGAGYLAGAMLAGDGVDWLGLLVVVVGTDAILAVQGGVRRPIGVAAGETDRRVGRAACRRERLSRPTG